VEIKLAYTPLPKQALFHGSKAKFRGYFGGMGCAKTICGSAEAILQSMWYPNNLGLVGRMTYPELRDTTRKEILEFPVDVDGHRTTLKESGFVKKFNQSENSLEFANGSTILFRALEDAFDKIKSLNLGFFYVDELTECNKDMWLALVGRLRRQRVHHTGFGTSNPEGRDWVWQMFVQNPTPDYFWVHSTTFENTYLPKGYVEGMLAQYPEEWIKRYIYGSFDSFEGLVYKEFQDKAPHVVEDFEIPDNWYRFISLDHGFRNPTGVGWFAVSPKGDVYLYDEFYQSSRLVSEVAEIIKTKSHEQTIRQYLIDPSCRNRDGKTGRSVIDEFSDNGLYFDPAENEVRAGINRVKEYFKIREDGTPKLKIFRSCKHAREELQVYKWKDLKVGEDKNPVERPEKKQDHMCDLIKYAIAHIYGMPTQKEPVRGWKAFLNARRREHATSDWMAA